MPLFEKNSRYLDKSERESFANFLNEFCNVFANEIFAGNCKFGGGEHMINIKDLSPIKQASRHIYK